MYSLCLHSKEQIKLVSLKVQSDLIRRSLYEYLLTYTLFGKNEYDSSKSQFYYVVALQIF